MRQTVNPAGKKRKKSNPQKELALLIQSRYPIVYVETWEEEGLEAGGGAQVVVCWLLMGKEKHELRIVLVR